MITINTHKEESIYGEIIFRQYILLYFVKPAEKTRKSRKPLYKQVREEKKEKERETIKTNIT